MSKTPRTEAATWHTRTPGNPVGADVVYASFAGGLEVELADANNARDEAIIKYTGQAESAEQAHKVTMARLEECRTELTAANKRIKELERSRKILSEAITNCLSYAGGRVSEWGDRAEGAFSFLESPEAKAARIREGREEK